MMSAPDARTSCGLIAFTVAAVPTGMKAGVRISPPGIAIVPARAAPSTADMVKEKRVIRGAPSGRDRPPLGAAPVIDPLAYPVLTAVAVFTGFIDAIAGGGGLIMMPSLL